MVQDDKLESYLHRTYYCDCAGRLKRKQTYKQWKAGDEVGTIGTRGYKTLSVMGRRLYVHRIIYFLCMRVWPPLIDHIDGNKLNNMPHNLRAATKSENAKNVHKAHSDSGSGYLGILKRKDTGKYSVRFQGKSLGCYDDIKEAVKVYELARAKSLTS